MSAERLATREFFQWQVAASATVEASPFQFGFGSVARELRGERFRVAGSLGSGGMGVVLDAWDQQLKRPVAIKVSTQVLNDSRRQRFAREGELAAALDHSGIVRVHGGGVTPSGYPFLIMEKVEGARPLDEVLEEVGPEAGLALLEEVARTVGFAHRAGVVHRDLKFENVLVDADGHTKVCDFGLALREGDERLTRTGVSLGTPRFMPPEQAGLLEGTRPGPPADVWALGVMLYHHVAGEYPFDGETWLEFTAALARGTPRLPDPGTPALRALCQRALAKNPAERYPNADAFADALAEAQRDPGSETPRWPKVVGAVLCALILVLLAAVAWVSRRTDPERARSAREALDAALAETRAGGLPPADELLREARAAQADAGSEASALSAALARHSALAALAEGDQAKAEAALARCGDGPLRALTEARVLGGRDPGRALELLDPLTRRRGEHREEAAALAARAALAAGELERGERYLQHLPEGEARTALEASLAGARALKAARAGRPSEALRALSAVKQIDLAEARRWARRVCGEWVPGAGDGRQLVETLERFEEVVALLGEEALPRSAGDLYVRVVKANSFGKQGVDETVWTYLLRMSRLNPRRLSPESVVVVVEHARNTWGTETWSECVRALEILVRCAEPELLRLARMFEGQETRRRFGKVLSEHLGAGWVRAFLRGFLLVEQLYAEPETAVSEGERATLVKGALEDLRSAQAAPRNPYVDGMLALWIPIAEQLGRSDRTVMIQELRRLIDEGHPDEHFLRVLLVRELKLANLPAEVLAEVPRARAATERRQEEIANGTVPLGGGRPVGAWDKDLKKDLKWARKKLKR